ncbi:hypothetical protein BJ508DRAFT_302256 [Ascobolus immersus RN42]|uniref:Mid2 domain-containing protein n=1 Tax=Ascobolus immersus RN42 TaxID=1160509 RepID=A0A3N4IJP8_ASCIM|nr:hypothetical protein BJ508DRAFT_302256 [Ascobolus immersus RN42]
MRYTQFGSKFWVLTIFTAISVFNLELCTAANIQRRADAEHVTLMNCVDETNTNVKSSQMAYFAGAPNSSPDAVANVGSEPGKTRTWEGGLTIAAFPDSVSFYAQIDRVVGAGEFAGLGKNDYVGFSCWSAYKKNLYRWDGKVCTMVYDCDHRPAPADAHITSINVSQSSFGPIQVGAEVKTTTKTTAVPPTTTSESSTGSSKANSTSVEQQTSPHATDAIPTTPAPTDSSTASANEATGIRTETLVGGIVGGLLGLLALAFVGIFFWLRRSRRQVGSEKFAELASDGEVRSELSGVWPKTATSAQPAYEITDRRRSELLEMDARELGEMDAGGTGRD